MRWLPLLLIGCSTPNQAPELGDAVARVAGQSISQAEVEALVRATGIPPREALHDLVSERLLVDHARAYEHAPAVERGVEQALVQRLLALELGEGDTQARAAALERLVTRLTAEVPVAYRDDVIQRVFAPVP